MQHRSVFAPHVLASFFLMEEIYCFSLYILVFCLFEFVFVCGVRQGSSSIPLHMDMLKSFLSKS
jgi:hypothetical protein